MPAWWPWRRFRGWPEAVPFDPAIARRATVALSDPAIDREVERRFAGARIGRLSVHRREGLVVVGIGLGLVTVLVAVRGAGELVLLLWLTLPVWIAIRVRGQRRVFLPRSRAVLRGVGIDLCVRCGHAIMGDAEAALCPECGFDHRRLPLGWVTAPTVDQA